MKSKNLKTYCITTKKFSFLESLNLNIIVGGANDKIENFPESWLLDSDNINISSKNKNFGTLTSIYAIWKNELTECNKNTWIGISHYRRFWLKNNHNKIISLDNLNANLLDAIPDEDLKYDAFVASPRTLTGYKPMKLIKKAHRNILQDPFILFNKKKHTIKLHFDMFHMYDGLIKASSVMTGEQKEAFLNYINNKTQYIPFSIFVLKRDKFYELCQSTFEWISNCEKIFDINNFKGYGQVRFFDFLAERYFSFWIEHNTKYKTQPFAIYDPIYNQNFKIIS